MIEAALMSWNIYKQVSCLYDALIILELSFTMITYFHRTDFSGFVISFLCYEKVTVVDSHSSMGPCGGVQDWPWINCHCSMKSAEHYYLQLYVVISIMSQLEIHNLSHTHTCFTASLCTVLDHIQKDYFCLSTKSCWLTLGWRVPKACFMYITGLELSMQILF